MTDASKRPDERNHAILNPDSAPDMAVAGRIEGDEPAKTPVMIQFEQEAEIHQIRVADCLAELKPEGPYQQFMAEEIAVATRRIEECRKDADAWRYRRARRAEGCWKIDRRAETTELAQGLPRRPARVAEQLRQSRHGCEFLLKGLCYLAGALRDYDRGGPPRPLDKDERRRVLDLLGVDLNQREGITVLDPPPGVDARAHQAMVIESEIAALQQLKAESLNAQDEEERAAAARGQATRPDAALREIRRYEAENHRQIKWAKEELRQSRERHERERERESAELCRPRRHDELARTSVPGLAVGTEPPLPAKKPEPAPMTMPMPVSAVPALARSADLTAVAPAARPVSVSKSFSTRPPRNRRERRALERQQNRS